MSKNSIANYVSVGIDWCRWQTSERYDWRDGIPWLISRCRNHWRHQRHQTVFPAWRGRDVDSQQCSK